MRKVKKPSGSKIMMISSMVIFGTISPFVRRIALSSGEIALYRAVMALFIIGGFLLLTRSAPDWRAVKKSLWLLLLSGAAMGLNWVFLFEAYQYTTVSVATVCYYFAPVLVTVLCPFIFREKMTPLRWICFVASTVGVVLIALGGGTSEGGALDAKGILFGLAAATCYATVILLNKSIVGLSGMHRTFFQFVAAVAVLAVYVPLKGGVGLGALDAAGVVCLLVLGILHTGVTYCMYFSSLKQLAGAEVAVLSYIDPLVAVILSVTLLQEAITPWQIVGAVLVFGFALLSQREEE